MKEKRWFFLAAFVVGIIVFIVLRSISVSKEFKEEAKLIRRSIYTHTYRSGDVLLFNGLGARGTFGANLTRALAGSTYTHIGMVYVHPETGRPYVWEMHLSGSRLMPLFAKMHNYRGHAAVRTLQPKISPEQQKRFDEFVRSRWGNAYSYAFIPHGYNRLFSFLPVPIATDTTKRQSAYYCCDLVADTLRYIGVLDFQPHDNADNPSALTPRDFTVRRQNLPLHSKFTYGPEIRLEVPKEMVAPSLPTTIQNQS